MKQRLITGIIAAIVFIGLLLLGGYAYGALIVLLAAIAFHEFAKMNKITGLGSGLTAGFLILLGIVLPKNLLWPDLQVQDEQLLWFAMLIFLALTVFFHTKTNLHKAAILFIGIIYIGYGFHYMITTRLALEDGLFWSLFIFGCIWLTDTGAYFTGMLFGRHRLAPKISPNKTIEGAVGGILFAVLFALLFSYLSGTFIGYGRAVLFAVIIAVTGQIGDLIQSAYKRLQGVKDSGNLLPGHGGVLDRVDSWLIVFPVLHLLGLLS